MNNKRRDLSVSIKSAKRFALKTGELADARRDFTPKHITRMIASQVTVLPRHLRFRESLALTTVKNDISGGKAIDREIPAKFWDIVGAIQSEGIWKEL